MKLKIKPALKLYLFIGGIALLLTLAIHPLLPNWFEKYTVEIQEDTRSFPNPNLLYHDFDHDGFSEMAVLKYQQDIDESALKIYAYNGGLMDQWTFKERWLNRSMIFGDYNKDGRDEVYVFTQSKDSLFLYGIDPQSSKKFILNRAFITCAPKNMKSWDLRPIAGIFVDSDEDGYDDIIFNVMAGHAKQPRQMFSFSIHQNKLLGTSPVSGAFLALPQKVKVNHDQYILMGGGVSLENTDEEIPYSDYSAWLTAFTPQLQFNFPPIAFKGRNTEIQVYPFGDKNEQIIVLIKYGGKEKNSVQLRLFNWQGEELARRKFHGRNWQLLPASKRDGTNCFLINRRKQTVFKIGADLKTISFISYTKTLDDIFPKQFDLDGDFNLEWIAQTGKSLLIIQNDFSHILPLDPAISLKTDCNISLKKNGNLPPQLSLQTGENKYLISYSPNPLYPFYLLSRIMLFLLAFLFVWLNTALFNLVTAHNHILKMLFRNPNRGMMLLNKKGLIRYMNHALIDQFHLELSEYKNRKAQDVFNSFSSIESVLNTLQRNKSQIKEEFSIDQDTVSVKGTIYGKPIFVLFGYAYGFYVEINDYSKPVQDDRLKVWSKTVQKMAHDIKTPLSSISLYLKTIDLKLEDQAPQARLLIEENLETMMNEMNRVREMTKNFLKFTNLEAPNFTICSLSDIIHRALERFKSYEEQGLQITLELDPQADMVTADEQQMSMAIQTVLENAVDAVKGKGLISIITTLNHRLDEHFKPYAEIEIADNGPGIPEDIKQKVFEPYFTTKTDGTGMGLAIARKILLDHQGKVEIVSRGKFTTVVRFMFPIGNIQSNKNPS